MFSAKKVPQSTASLTENDSITIAEISSLLGFPASAVIAAIQHNRSAVRKPFYSIADLAERWVCSRGTVYNVLSQHEGLVLQLVSPKGKKHRGKRSIPASTVERIEKMLMERVA